MDGVGKFIVWIIERVYAFALVAAVFGLCIALGTSLGLLLALETDLPHWLLSHLGSNLKPDINAKDMELLVISAGGILGFGMGCSAVGWS